MSLWLAAAALVKPGCCHRTITQVIQVSPQREKNPISYSFVFHNIKENLSNTKHSNIFLYTSFIRPTRTISITHTYSHHCCKLQRGRAQGRPLQLRQRTVFLFALLQFVTFDVQLLGNRGIYHIGNWGLHVTKKVDNNAVYFLALLTVAPRHGLQMPQEKAEYPTTKLAFPQESV